MSGDENKQDEYNEYEQLLICCDIRKQIRANQDCDKALAYHQWLTENVVKLVCDNGCRRYCKLVDRLGHVMETKERFEGALEKMEGDDEVSEEERSGAKKVADMANTAFDVGSYEMLVHGGVLAGMFYNGKKIIDIPNSDIERNLPQNVLWADIEPCINRLRWLIQSNQKAFPGE